MTCLSVAVEVTFYSVTSISDLTYILYIVVKLFYVPIYSNFVAVDYYLFDKLLQ